MNGSAERKGRRGRKPGDGVLKELNPEMGLLEKGLRLFYGRRFADEIAMMVQEWRDIGRWKAELERRAKAVGQERIKAAEPGNVVEGEVIRGRVFSRSSGPKFVNGKDAEASLYWDDRLAVESQAAALSSRLLPMVTEALTTGGSAWFKKVAGAIDLEAAANGKAVFDLHLAVLGQARGFNIEQLSERLKDRKPAGQTVEDWKCTLRRACREVGYPLKGSKPGPQPKRPS